MLDNGRPAFLPSSVKRIVALGVGLGVGLLVVRMVVVLIIPGLRVVTSSLGCGQHTFERNFYFN